MLAQEGQPAWMNKLAITILLLVFLLSSSPVSARLPRLDDTAPGPFSKASPSSQATLHISNPTLTWGQSLTAAGYRYCIDMINDNTCGSTWKDVGNALSVSLSGLVVNTTYYWQVFAYDTEGKQTYANGGTWWSFHTARASAFSKLTPPDRSNMTVRDIPFSWGASTGAISYEFCADQTNDNACDHNAWSNAGVSLTWTLHGVAAEKTYYWQVRARDGWGVVYANSGAWWHFSTPKPAGFHKLTPPDGAKVGTLEFDLAWDHSSRADFYEYCVDTVKNSSCDTGWVALGDVSTVTLSGLAANTTYYWQVRAVNDFGSTLANGGVWWSFRAATADAFSKFSPGDTAFLFAPDTALTWTASTGMDCYEYCIDTTANETCETTWLNLALNQSAPLTGLSEDTTYYWQVRAKNTFGYTYANEGKWWRFTHTGDLPLYLPVLRREDR